MPLKSQKYFAPKTYLNHTSKPSTHEEVTEPETTDNISIQPHRHVQRLKSLRQPLPQNQGEVLQLQQTIGNRAVSRLLQNARSVAGSGQSGIIQRDFTGEGTSNKEAETTRNHSSQPSFTPGTYVEISWKNYACIEEVIQDQAGFVQLKDMISGRKRIIGRSGGEYRQFSRSGGMSGYQTTDLEGPVYRVKVFENRAERTELAGKNDLATKANLGWAMETAKKDSVKARECLVYLDQFKENEFELAKDQLIKTNLDPKVAEERVKFLLPYSSQGQTHLKLAEEQLTEAEGNISKAHAFTEFLMPRMAEAPHLFALAKREIKTAGGIAQQAEARLRSFDPLHTWADEQATTTAKAEETKLIESAESEFDKTREALTAEYKVPAASGKKGGKRKPAARGKGKQPAKPKINPEYTEKLITATKTKEDAIASAETNRPTRQQQELDKNEQFIADMTENGVDGGTIRALLTATKDDQAKVRSFYSLLVAQPNPNDLSLVKSIMQKDHSAQTNLVNTCQNLLNASAPFDRVERLAFFSQEMTHSPSIIWLIKESPNLSDFHFVNALNFLKKFKNNAPLALQTIQTTGVNGNLFDIETFFETSTDAISWLLPYHGQADFNFLLSTIKQNSPHFLFIKELFRYNDNNQKFSIPVLCEWLGGNALVAATKYREVLEMMVNNRCEADPAIARILANWKVLPTDPKPVFLLARAQALAEKKSLNLQVLKKDVHYKGGSIKGDKNKARTGFVGFTFANNDILEVHTHWKVQDMVFTSMHVQYNKSNGLEINNTKDYKDVAEAIKFAHNNAPSGFEPTTDPPGNKLN